MKVTVINGSARHGSTWHCKEEFLNALKEYDEVEAREFTLPNDMPNFCRGCYSCFYNGESTCPDSEYTKPISEALCESDVIVLTSPVYAFGVSGQLKALLDHLCFMWVSHRPNPKMFSKAGVIFTTTAGMGLGNTVKTMKDTLFFWGLKRIFVFKKAVAAMKWDGVNGKKKEQIKKETVSMARKVAAAVKNERMLPRLSFRFMFSLMRSMQKKNGYNPTDRAHWESQGWLGKASPFKG